jgi:hypothetical protein
MGGARARAAVAAAVIAVVAGPAVAGPAVGATPPTTTTPATTSPTTTSPTTTTAPVPTFPPPATPGGSVAWSPQGRTAIGRPLLYTGSAGGAFVAWMDPQLARPVVVPGAADGAPSPWGGQVAPESRPFLFASFNGGFKWNDSNGGVVAFGATYKPIDPGLASLIVYGDGTFNVGLWARDVDPAKPVVAARQNLDLLVDGGHPTGGVGNAAAWGGSVAGAATMRSAIGVDGHGALLWAGGRLTPADLANALVAAGAVRAMELDINPDWVNFNAYDVAPDGTATGNGLFGATGANRYLHADPRDFVAVMVRGTVAPGASAKVGGGPIKGSAWAR